MNFVPRYIFLVFLLCYSVFLNAQSLDDLNKRRKSIEENISQLSNLIQETSKTKSLTINNLKLIENRIKLKKDLISQIDSEIEYLNNQINLNQYKIDSLEVQVSKIKLELAHILQTKFKNRDKVQLILFILSSESFNQAYTRVKFYKNLIAYQERKIDELKILISSVNTNKLSLQNNFKHLKLKQVEKESELSKLVVESKNYNIKVADIKKKEKDLKKDLIKEKKKSDEIALQIKKLIEEEIKRKSKPESKTYQTNLVLAKQFKDNFGKLPPPVRDGIVTSPFGESSHPYLKGVKIKNNGIDITVSKNSNVYCIFEGEVRKIFNVPLSGLALIVRHGTFYTVYSNLSNLEVKVGDIVKINQKIGEVSRVDDKIGILHLEIWNERSSENPILWIPSYKRQ